MKQNPVKAALRAGQPQVGTWLSLGNVYATRLMARGGFPWLTLDIEHSPGDWRDAALGAERGQLGFLAQEVERVLPSLVTTGRDGFKRVRYPGFAPARGRR